MARTFDGTDDRIHCSFGNCNAVGYGTFAALIKRASDTTDDAIIGMVQAAGTRRHGFGINPTDQLQWFNHAGPIDSPTITVLSADGWVLVAASKATGTVAPRFHKLNLGTGVWTHENGSVSSDSTLSNQEILIGAHQTAGAPDKFFAGDMEIVAYWNTVLSDTEIEQLGQSFLMWRALAPTGLWHFDLNATAGILYDQSGGGANQTNITGTAIPTSGPILWNRWGDTRSMYGLVVIPEATPLSVVSNPPARLLKKIRKYGARWGTISWDSFNRLMGETRDGLGRADTSLSTTLHVWEELVYGGAAEAPYWIIDLGKARCRNVDTAIWRTTWLRSGLIDVRVGVDIVLDTELTSPGPGIFFRGAPDGSGLLFTIVSTTQGRWGRLTAAGSYVSILTVDLPATVAAGTSFRLEVRASSTTCRAYLDNAEIGDGVLIDQQLYETRHGMACYQDDGHTFNNFRCLRY